MTLLFSGDTTDMQKRTSYVKAFESYRITVIHRQTDRHDRIIYADGQKWQCM